MKKKSIQGLKFANKWFYDNSLKKRDDNSSMKRTQVVRIYGRFIHQLYYGFIDFHDCFAIISISRGIRSGDEWTNVYSNPSIKNKQNRTYNH